MFSVRMLLSIGLDLAVAEFLKMDLGNERDILLVYHLSIMCGITIGKMILISRC